MLGWLFDEEEEEGLGFLLGVGGGGWGFLVAGWWAGISTGVVRRTTASVSSRLERLSWWSVDRWRTVGSDVGFGVAGGLATDDLEGEALVAIGRVAIDGTGSLIALASRPGSVGKVGRGKAYGCDSSMRTRTAMFPDHGNEAKVGSFIVGGDDVFTVVKASLFVD